MATSAVAVTEGSGKNLATHSLTEDAITKQLSRAVLNSSAGVDVKVTAASTAPVAADPALVVSISPNSINGNGQAARAASAPVTLSTEDMTAISATSVVTNAGAFATQAATNSAAIYNGTTSMTPAWAVISASSSGANSIKTADATRKIRVLAWDLSPSAAVNAKWQSASTDKTGLYYMAAAGNGQRASFNQIGWFETAVNEALNLNLSGAVAVGGVVCYVLV